MSAPSIRARVRAEMTEEIKSIARRHIASDGANLSLRAVARDLGVVSSAIYRYFASRDDLLTALIIDAYNSLGDAVEAADAGQPNENLLGRWLAMAHAVREWALAQPHEYALIYGSPVPGYRAPADTIGPATRSSFALLRLLKDGVDLGFYEGDGDRLPEPLEQDLATLRANAAPNVPASLLVRGMAAWLLVFGAVSFELFGQFNQVINDRRAFFDFQIREAFDNITPKRSARRS
jgi:AcrR family transcriptional regulator